MTNDERSEVSAEGEQAWRILVDSQLPEIWSAAEYCHLTPQQAEAMTEVVLLRVLEWVTGPHAPAPRSSAVTTTVRAFALAEAERMRRLSVWQGPTPTTELDLGALEATSGGGPA